MKFNPVLIASGVCLLVSMAVISSCKKPDEDPTASFDQTPLLQNIGNNIIIPNYQTLSVAVNKLDSATTAFNAAPTETSLSNLQVLFKDAYRAWQYSAIYDFGPSAAVYLKSNVNTFPVTVSQVTSNVTSGSYNLDAAVNLSAKGFPAVDYLLYGVAADNASRVLEYTTTTNFAKRKQYLADVVTDIKTRVTSTLNGWLPSGGNYINQFVSSTGTDAGSSLSLVVNQFIQDYDNGKYYKVFIPLGTQGVPSYPEKTEAYYSGISAELVILTTNASQELYLGKSRAGVDGIGFDDYLDQIGESTLNNSIKAQYTSALTIWATVGDPLSATIGSNPALVNSAYTELQKQIPMIKRQMTSAMGVLVAFGDDDGD
ncbi:MAG: hypothetical protein JWM14_1341 [Chitinophagaceae bacterium]|nr:hypothetical protein [Chitinophagaceae bacterium]